MSAPAISLDGVEVRFGRAVALENVSATFDAGSMTAVVGPNGAGKSTLLRAVMGLVRLARGRVATPGARAGGIAYLPQLLEIDRTFPIDVVDLVSLGAWSRTGLLGALNRGEEERVREAIRRVGLEGLETVPIGQLSGGQLQRTLFARLIVQDAPVVLLDEPFAAVDSATVDDLMQLLHAWHGEGRTIVAVLHDMRLARRDFPRTLHLERRVVAQGRSEDVLDDAGRMPLPRQATHRGLVAA